MTNTSPSLAQQKLYGALRTTLITYGVAAFAFLDRPGSSERYLLVGVASQILMIIARRLVTRFVPGEAAAVQVTLILEVIADGATVLLFALGSFGAIGYFDVEP